jgi:hypothetical protein
MSEFLKGWIIFAGSMISMWIWIITVDAGITQIPIYLEYRGDENGSRFK